VIALAAEQARSDAPGKIATHIVGITRQGTKCTDFASCASVMDAGDDPDYDGQSGAIEMLDDGDPGEASYGVMRFAKDDLLQRLAFKTRRLPIRPRRPCWPRPISAGRGRRAHHRHAGPTTGDDSSLAAPEAAGIRLAVDDINADGGVLGRPVTLITGDSGDGSSGAASAAVATELSRHVDAIVGPSSAEVANQVLAAVTGAGVILFSPAGTAQSLSTLDDHGLFFRLAPSDVMQAKVLADLISQDGLLKVSVLAEKNSFGQGLSSGFGTAFTQDGGTVLDTTNFDPTSRSGTDLAAAAVADHPDGVLILADNLPVAVLLHALVAAGHPPSDLPTYVANINGGLATQYAALGG